MSVSWFSGGARVLLRVWFFNSDKFLGTGQFTIDQCSVKTSKIRFVQNLFQEAALFIRDLLVASVAIGLGLSIIQVAWTNRGWCFDSFFVKQIESKRGRTAARKVLGIGGSAIILVGTWTVLAPLITSNRENNVQSPPIELEHTRQ